MANSLFLGNLITDAMIAFHTQKPTNGSWGDAAIAILNSGGIRAPIEKGGSLKRDRYSWFRLIDWLIDWLGFYAISAIFQPCNGSDYKVNDRLWNFEVSLAALTSLLFFKIQRNDPPRGLLSITVYFFNNTKCLFSCIWHWSNFSY